MKKEIPELDAVVGIGSNGKICDIIREILLDKQAVCSYGAKTELSMEGGRIISTEPFYAYIKIAEGCSNNCTYCEENTEADAWRILSRKPDGWLRTA